MVLASHIHGRPKPGEDVSGDAGEVRTVGEVTWMVLSDGLGHGHKAAKASRAALEAFAELDDEVTVQRGLSLLHARTAGTRGAAVVLARFDDQGMSVAGVGNVEFRALTGPSIPFVSANGILGGRMPNPRGFSFNLEVGARLIAFTDGIERRVDFTSMLHLDGPTLCQTLLDEHSLARDDATVIHLTYLGASGLLGA